MYGTIRTKAFVGNGNHDVLLPSSKQLQIYPSMLDVMWVEWPKDLPAHRGTNSAWDGGQNREECGWTPEEIPGDVQQTPWKSGNIYWTTNSSSAEVVLLPWTALLSTYLWLVFGEIMFFLLLDHGCNRNPVTNAIRMFCKNEVAKSLRELLPIMRRFLCQMLVNEPFCRPSTGTEAAAVNLLWRGERLFSN